MVFLNGAGILVVAVFLGIGFALDSFLRATVSDDVGGILVYSVAYVLGLGAELAGFRPRVLFLPVWILALAAVVYMGGEFWGWIGGVTCAVPGVGGALLLFKLMAVPIERRKLRDACKLMARYVQNQDRLELRDKKYILRKVFFVNTAMPNSGELVTHNKMVVDCVLMVLGDRFCEEDGAKLRAFSSQAGERMESPDGGAWPSQLLLREIRSILRRANTARSV